MSEKMELDFDLHDDLVAETSPAAMLEYVAMCFRSATIGNPNYTAVGFPEVAFIRVRDRFLTGRVKFEVERSEVRSVQTA
jgi:hypothetical protein